VKLDTTTLGEIAISNANPAVPRSSLQVRIELDRLYYRLTTGANHLIGEGILSQPATHAQLETDTGELQLDVAEQTRGFEELFMLPTGTLSDRGWSLTGGMMALLESRELHVSSSSSEPARLQKSLEGMPSYEAVVNLRIDSASTQSEVRIIIGDSAASHIALSLGGDQEKLQMYLEYNPEEDTQEGTRQQLPAEAIAPYEYFQLRIRREKDRVAVWIEHADEIVMTCPPVAPKLCLLVDGSAMFDMVRVTELLGM
jgi:hypothetical protein